VLGVLSHDDVLPDASTAELELVAKEVDCIAAGGESPTVAPADEWYINTYTNIIGHQEYVFFLLL